MGKIPCFAVVNLSADGEQPFKISGSILRISNFIAENFKDKKVEIDMILLTPDRNLSRKYAEEV